VSDGRIPIAHKRKPWSVTTKLTTACSMCL